MAPRPATRSIRRSSWRRNRRPCTRPGGRRLLSAGGHGRRPRQGHQAHLRRPSRSIRAIPRPTSGWASPCARRTRTPTRARPSNQIAELNPQDPRRPNSNWRRHRPNEPADPRGRDRRTCAPDFFQFPGHTWLQQDTQIYLPLLEHRADPTLFHNEILVQNPAAAFTVYDDIALALYRVTGLGFRELLQGLQIITRALGIWACTSWRNPGIRDGALPAGGGHRLVGRDHQRTPGAFDRI